MEIEERLNKHEESVIELRTIFAEAKEQIANVKDTLGDYLRTKTEDTRSSLILTNKMSSQLDYIVDELKGDNCRDGLIRTQHKHGEVILLLQEKVNGNEREQGLVGDVKRLNVYALISWGFILAICVLLGIR